MTEFFSGWQDFHFVRPLWLWALAVLALLWALIGTMSRSTHWENYIAKDKLEALRVSGGRYSNSWRWILIFCWIMATVAAAGPTWKKVPVPTIRDQSAMVILLDLSRSMLAQDLAPDRLTRAKIKLIDILRQRGDGQTALIAYAGDPHTLSPLTDDASTLEALLPALHPTIMPIQGSNTEAAIELAMSLLRDAGIASGELLLMTDGVAPEAQRYIRDHLEPSYKLSILGIGTTEAVPIPGADGGFIRDSRGEIVLSTLNRDELQILAGVSGGRYVELQADDSDIDYLLQDDFTADKSETDEAESLLYDSWQDMGYWLILLLLPFAAWNFRKGAIYVLPIYIFPIAFLLPNESQALSWDDLWLTKDQQAAKLMDEGSPQEAAKLFENQDWQATADFKAENYEGAAEGFGQKEDVTSLYNLGNSLAFKQDFEAAIAAYDQVLALSPEHEDAMHNKAVIEQLMQQQEQQSQNQESQDQQSQDQQNSDQSNQQQSQQQESENQDSQQQSAQNQDSQQQQESQQQSDQQQNQQESQQAENQQQESQQQGSEQQETEGEDQQQSAESETEESEQEPSEEQLASMMAAEPTPEDLQDSSEQWLRAIPDDPSGLLRRKFDYETRQRRMEERFMLRPPGSTDKERY